MDDHLTAVCSIAVIVALIERLRFPSGGAGQRTHPIRCCSGLNTRGMLSPSYAVLATVEKSVG